MKFNGKDYKLAYTRDTMPAAQADADSARKEGFNARIITRSLKSRYDCHRHMFFDVYVHDAKQA